MNLNELKKHTDTFENTSTMPVFFVGHGSPMNAIDNNAFTKSLGNIGLSFQEKPKAVLVVSAHWLTSGTHVLVSEKPRTIHDFGGFPEELYKIQYPAAGAPQFARETGQHITTTNVSNDDQWGLDHGSWSVLRHIFPDASIPVFQLSIDYTRPPQYHYDLAKELAWLRNKGVLIIGSGNIVHNLYQVDFNEKAKPYEWAVGFDELVKAKLMNRNFEDLINYTSLGKDAMLSVPTNDHYLPMLYSLGLAGGNEPITFTFEEIQNASISMRCFRIG